MTLVVKFRQKLLRNLLVFVLLVLLNVVQIINTEDDANSQQQQQYQQQAPQQLSPLEETWSFYGKTMQLLENNPQMKASWNNLPKEVKEQRLIDLYCKKGNGHLVPYLQKHIFPTLKDSDLLLLKLRPPVL